MLHATELMGAETYDAQGNFVGRVRELFIEPAEQPNRIAYFLLSRGRFQPLVALHDQVASLAPNIPKALPRWSNLVLRLNVGERLLEVYEPNEGWLAVRKDLLDQQIIDTSGRKVVRVNDVDLIEQRANGSMELRLMQADVGLTGALRRLLQGVVSPALIRKIQSKLPRRTSWRKWRLTRRPTSWPTCRRRPPKSFCTKCRIRRRKRFASSSSSMLRPRAE